jgi:prolyl-tRNA editing enzyme YbaK/EbsC (Cys-tRNA(Pro) deacylase)
MSRPRRGTRVGWDDRGVAAPADFPDTVVFPSETRTAADAAAAIGCEVAAIVKSLVFRRSEQTVLVLCSGANTVDAKRLELARAQPAHVRAISGFAIGGVPPYGWASAPDATLIDEDLLAFDEIWAAAGTPRSVFPPTPAELLARCGGDVAAIKTSR